MQARDRFCNMLFIAMALVVWVAVAQVVTTTYPRDNPTTGLVGAGLIGSACGLTAVPLFWLVPFARHRRLALLGDCGRVPRPVLLCLGVGLWVCGTERTPRGAGGAAPPAGGRGAAGPPPPPPPAG